MNETREEAYVEAQACELLVRMMRLQKAKRWI